MTRFLANVLVFYVVDGLKAGLIICFNVLKLLCKEHVTLEKNDQNHTKTICWKCAGFVMVFSEKPSEDHHFS